MSTEQAREQRASGVSIELRPYQWDALTAIEAAALRGIRRQVVSLPTGAGKTVIFAHLLVEPLLFGRQLYETILRGDDATIGRVQVEAAIVRVIGQPL